MVPENKQNRSYKQINFIGFQNNRHPSQHSVGNVHKASGTVSNGLFRNRSQAPDQGSTVDFFRFPAPEEHHELRKFCRRGGNPRKCDSGSVIDS
jgi:hypothetical protein